MGKKYEDLTKKEKQLLATQYPYSSSTQLFASRILSTKRQENDFIKMAEEKDNVSLLKRKEHIIDQDKTTLSENEKRGSRVGGLIQVAYKNFDEAAIRDAMDIAVVGLDPLEMLNDLFAIEMIRLQSGLDLDKDAGMPTNETSAVMNNLVHIAKLMNDIQEGQQLNINFKNSFSELIMAAAEKLDDETIDAEYEVKPGLEDSDLNIIIDQINNEE